jgi:hypothetical protein
MHDPTKHLLPTVLPTRPCMLGAAAPTALCISMKELYEAKSQVHDVDVPQLVAKFSGQQKQVHPNGASSVPAAADEQPPPADGGKSPAEHSIASSKTTADPPATGQAGAAGSCAGVTASPTSGVRDGTPAAAPAAAVFSDHKQRPSGESLLLSGCGPACRGPGGCSDSVSTVLLILLHVAAYSRPFLQSLTCQLLCGPSADSAC